MTTGHLPDNSSCRHQRRTLLATGMTAVLVLGVLIITALWHYRTPLTNHYLKPYIEHLLSNSLDATVVFANLDFSTRHLAIEGVSVIAPPLYELVVPVVIIDFSPKKLLQGQIERLQLHQPHLRLNPATQTDRDIEITWQKPTIRIDLIEIIKGEIDLETDGRMLPIRALDLTMQPAPSGTTALSLLLGDEPSLPLSSTFEIRLDESLELLITTLVFDGISLLGSPLDLSPLNDGSIGGEISLVHLDRQRISSWLAMFGQEDPLPADLDFELHHFKVEAKLTGNDIESWITAASINLKQNDVSLLLRDADLTLSRMADQWRAGGRLSMPSDATIQFEVHLPDGKISAGIQGNLPDIARVPELWGDNDRLPVSGDLNWSLDILWDNGLVDLNGTAAVTGSAIYLDDTTITPDSIQGSFRIRGELPQVTGEADFTLGRTPFAKVRGNLQQQTIEFQQTELRTLANLVGASLWPDIIDPSGWIAGTLQLDLGQPDLVGDMDFRGNNWRIAGFDLDDIHLGSPFRLHQHQLEFTKFSTILRAGGHGAIIPSAQMAGTLLFNRDTIDVNIASLTLKNLDYLATDDMSALAGANITLGGALRLENNRHKLHADLSGSLLIQEVLYHSFYGEMSELPLNWSFRGHWDSETGRMQADHAHLFLADVGELRGSGIWQQETLEGSVALRLFDLNKGFAGKLRPILSPLIPQLKQMDMSGTLETIGEIAITGDSRHISATIRPSAITLRDRENNLEITDLTGEIPLILSSRDNLAPIVEKGRISFSRLEAGPTHATRRELNIASAPNLLSFADPLEIQLGQGTIRIDNLSFGFYPGENHLGGRVRVEGVDLEQLTRELEMTPLQGTLTADLGEVVYSNGRLLSNGDMLIRIFDGEMVIRNVSAADIFSSYRSFEADIDLTGIDLGQMTQTFEFGEINGTIDGYIHNLRLFGTIPSAFVAEIRTRDQGQRNISVKAINNLSVISQGGFSAVLSRGIYRFIDFYRYRRIGIFCTLNNDVFALKGTARSDSDLYLVDGGLLPPRINIVAPGSNISFREMLRRLGRIDRTGPL